MRSPEKLPKGAVQPQEIFTNIADDRYMLLSSAGEVNNHIGFLDYLVKKGIKEAGQEELRSFSAITADTKENQIWQKLSSRPDIKQEKDEWYAKIHLDGLRMIFGYRAMQINTQVMKERFLSPDGSYTWSYPRVRHRGKLPATLGDQAEEVESLLQEGFSLRGSEEEGELFLDTLFLEVAALYEDRVVTLSAESKTWVGAEDIWELDVRTDLREPLVAITCFPKDDNDFAIKPHRLDGQE